MNTRLLFNGWRVTYRPMRNITSFVVAALSVFCLAPAYAVTFSWATVGNAGNVGDTEIRLDGTTGYGAVSYSYRIAKHEVTNAQYVEFLNAVAKTDTFDLYNTSMASSTWGGIERSDSSGSYRYSVKPAAVGQGPGGTDGDDYSYANKPVVYVSFFDAMRFVNWLENGQPAGVQGPGTTEDGVYTIGNGLNEVRKPGARYFLPSEDEWYKAAYFDLSGRYYDYPTSTDALPNNNLPSTDTGNSANFSTAEFATGNFSYPMTDVGAYTLSTSPYGLFDMAGNVIEWNETVMSGIFRVTSGGSWSDGEDRLRAYYRLSALPTRETIGTGIRVASIPEPGAVLMALIGCAGILWCMKVK